MFSADEKATFVGMIKKFHDNWNTLNAWEKGFVEDQEKRFEEYGDDTRLSPKQWDMLRKIENVIDHGRSRR